ncbi:cardiolipin synthase [Mumia flava]|uniref:Cardiolipin synthase n=1 Tax=Mumia flava TaxID=1348852 RepID=A0A2M9BE95_9ACTN|nr:phospholipase D-like domain-containing protein [Mumia flava]PJJ56271.1 cardiolipin synthase [Mumia flava]
MSTLLTVALWVVVIWFVLIVIVTTVLMTVVARHTKKDESAEVSFPTLEPISEQVGDSTITLYTYGQDVYDAMLAEIRGAQDHVYLESYIWKNDELGEEFKREVIAAADRGVDVRLVYDSFANAVVPRAFKQFGPKIQVMRHGWFSLWILVLRIRKLGRDHRKILVVDGRVGFVGGYNIGADYATKWRDTHMRIQGPLTWELQNAFVDFWNAHAKKRKVEPLDDPGADHWEPRLRARRNAPIQMSFPIRNMYLDAIDRAKVRISITQAYFIPDSDILDALLRAAGRGVDVRVLVPENSNHVMADWLSKAFYSRMLEGGIRILFYQPTMVHAKTATIDGRWATVGTANIDRLSLTGNYEINVEVVEESVAAMMDRIFENDCTATRELTLDEWSQRGRMARFGEVVLIPLRPIM